MTTYVYFIQGQDSGRIKIGYSANPVKRLASLQTSSSEHLALIGVVEGNERLERRLHATHQQYHLHGEWFSPGVGLITDIRRRLGLDEPTRQQEASMRRASSEAGADASMRARAGAHLSWANTTDRTARTAPARAAMDAKFLAEADGDPVRAAHLRKAHYQRLALASARARRARKATA